MGLNNRHGAWFLLNEHLFSFDFQDFPILCQTCLGENPYIRMVSEHYCVIIINWMLFSCSADSSRCVDSNVFMLVFTDQGEVWERMQGVFFSI